MLISSRRAFVEPPLFLLPRSVTFFIMSCSNSFYVVFKFIYGRRGLIELAGALASPCQVPHSPLAVALVSHAEHVKAFAP